MKALHVIAFILLAIGGLNWGLVGLGGFAGAQDWNAIHMLLGSSMTLEAAAYALIGISAVWILLTHKSGCRACRA